MIVFRGCLPRIFRGRLPQASSAAVFRDHGFLGGFLICGDLPRACSASMFREHVPRPVIFFL